MIGEAAGWAATTDQMACLCARLEVLVGPGRAGWDDSHHGRITDPGLSATELAWWSRLNEAGLRGSTWRIVGTLLVLVGVGLLVDSWLRLRPGREPRDLTAEPLPKHARRYFKHLPGIRAGLHPWAVLGVWGLPFLLAPPIFSHDAYSYAAQGWLLENGISPMRGIPGCYLGPSPTKLPRNGVIPRPPTVL